MNPRLNPQHPINDEPQDPIEAAGDDALDLDGYIDQFLDEPVSDHGC